eukprot:GHVU01209555.1.p1 GENE.GHVU01209555.1~~GHVU01209555.1.p1  ORF type:complete len:672 (+),score=49.31 GHVU01209555.1:652-2667(+)
MDTRMSKSSVLLKPSTRWLVVVRFLTGLLSLLPVLTSFGCPGCRLVVASTRRASLRPLEGSHRSVASDVHRLLPRSSDRGERFSSSPRELSTSSAGTTRVHRAPEWPYRVLADAATSAGGASPQSSAQRQSSGNTPNAGPPDPTGIPDEAGVLLADYFEEPAFHHDDGHHADAGKSSVRTNGAHEAASLLESQTKLASDVQTQTQSHGEAQDSVLAFEISDWNAVRGAPPGADLYALWKMKEKPKKGLGPDEAIVETYRYYYQQALPPDMAHHSAQQPKSENGDKSPSLLKMSRSAGNFSVFPTCVVAIVTHLIVRTRRLPATASGSARATSSDSRPPARLPLHPYSHVLAALPCCSLPSLCLCVCPCACGRVCGIFGSTVHALARPSFPAEAPNLCPAPLSSRAPCEARCFLLFFLPSSLPSLIHSSLKPSLTPCYDLRCLSGILSINENDNKEKTFLKVKRGVGNHALIPHDRHVGLDRPGLASVEGTCNHWVLRGEQYICVGQRPDSEAPGKNKGRVDYGMTVAWDNTLFFDSFEEAAQQKNSKKHGEGGCKVVWRDKHTNTNYCVGNIADENISTSNMAKHLNKIDRAKHGSYRPWDWKSSVNMDNFHAYVQQQVPLGPSIDPEQHLQPRDDEEEGYQLGNKHQEKTDEETFQYRYAPIHLQPAPAA